MGLTCRDAPIETKILLHTSIFEARVHLTTMIYLHTGSLRPPSALAFSPSYCSGRTARRDPNHLFAAASVSTNSTVMRSFVMTMYASISSNSMLVAKNRPGRDTRALYGPLKPKNSPLVAVHQSGLGFTNNFVGV